MIRLIQGKNKFMFPREIAEMHELRKRVFFERMRWNVSLINSWEIDGYDALDPLYVVNINENERVVGGVRLLPTTGFNMLNDTFHELLPEGKRVESSLIWEASRFSIDLHAEFPVGRKGISRGTAELGLAMNEIGMKIGLTHIVTVYDELLHRVLKRAGCAGEPISEPKRIGDVLCYAVFFEVGEATERALRAASGIEGSVLETEMVTLAVAA